MRLSMWIDVMPGSDGLRILSDFLKKAVSWVSDLGEASWFSNLDEASPMMDYGMPARCWVRWNSQHSKNCVSLSWCWKSKYQEGNKSFVPEQRKSSVFRVLRDSYACERFTDRYILHIHMHVYISHNHIWLCYAKVFCYCSEIGLHFS